MTATLPLIRRGLLVILTLGLGGTILELLLLRHTEGFWQLVPLVLLSLALLTLGWYGVSRKAAPLRLLSGIMWLFLLSGIVGTIQHFRGNISFEQESDPSLTGLALYHRALEGATPSLAPGTMVQLGLVGLLFLLRHPLLSRTSRDEHPPEQGPTQ